MNRLGILCRASVILLSVLRQRLGKQNRSAMVSRMSIVDSWFTVFLHLLGHDHVHGGHQARIMKEEENRLLEVIDAVLGSPDAS